MRLSLPLALALLSCVNLLGAATPAAQPAEKPYQDSKSLFDGATPQRAADIPTKAVKTEIGHCTAKRTYSRGETFEFREVAGTTIQRVDDLALKVSHVIFDGATLFDSKDNDLTATTAGTKQDDPYTRFDEPHKWNTKLSLRWHPTAKVWVTRYLYNGWNGQVVLSSYCWFKNSQAAEEK